MESVEKLWFTAGGFCGHGRFAVVAKLALAFTAWDLCSSNGAKIAVRLADGTPRLTPLLTAFLTGVGIASVPIWIYRGYGVFRFEGTRAEVRCIFTEGFGMAFPFVVAPALAVVSLVLAWFAQRLNPVPAE